jgi:hypothetical protein
MGRDNPVEILFAIAASVPVRRIGERLLVPVGVEPIPAIIGGLLK